MKCRIRVLDHINYIWVTIGENDSIGYATGFSFEYNKDNHEALIKSIETSINNSFILLESIKEEK